MHYTSITLSFKLRARMRSQCDLNVGGTQAKSAYARNEFSRLFRLSIGC